ncbi:MAG: hypothetical protein AB1405_16305, partial [Bdellovibrionota bacterium]
AFGHPSPLAGRGRGWGVVLVLALFAASCKPPPPPAPELKIGTPGSVEECTLAEEKNRFYPDEPLAFVFDYKKPFDVDTITAMGVWVDGEGNLRLPGRSQVMVVIRSHAKLCAVSPDLKAGDFFYGSEGLAALQMLRGNEIAAQARLEVVPRPPEEKQTPPADSKPEK